MIAAATIPLPITLEYEMSAIPRLHAVQNKSVKKKSSVPANGKLKMIFDQVRAEARKVPAGKRIRDVSALIEKGRRYGA